MSILPILVALRRHKTGTLLIVLQIALTLAIVCNALLVVGIKLEMMDRHSGIDESDLLLINTSHAGVDLASAAGKARLDASVQGDLQALRKLPDVADAYESNTMPLALYGLILGLRKTADPQHEVEGALFFSDEHTLPTLGVRLIAGRNFNADEITSHARLGTVAPAAIIITRHMADELFPAGDALGKQVYMSDVTAPSTIVGVVGDMVSNAPHGFSDRVWNSIFLPYRVLESQRFYVVRARPGRLQAALQSVPAALYAQDPLRVIPDGWGYEAGIRTFEQVRADAFRSDKVVMEFMLVISLIMLVVTAAGIVGLTSFWVGQRRRQIGVRRALGATRRDILLYFLTENGLISCAGVLLGAVLAMVFNLQLERQFEMHRLPWPYLAWGVLVLLALGQAAVFGPALRASRVPPIEATRAL